MADDSLGKELRNILDKIKQREQRIQNQRKFDVLGKLPPWLPMNDQLKIDQAKAHLYNSAKTEIRKWIKNFDKARNSGNVEEGIEPDANITWPVDFTPEIGDLSFYDKVIKTGKEKGLKMLVGEEYAKAIKGRENRLKGTGRGALARRNEAEEKTPEIMKTVDRIRARLPRSNRNKIFKKASEELTQKHGEGYSPATIRRHYIKNKN